MCLNISYLQLQQIFYQFLYQVYPKRHKENKIDGAGLWPGRLLKLITSKSGVYYLFSKNLTDNRVCTCIEKYQVFLNDALTREGVYFDTTVPTFN